MNSEEKLINKWRNLPPEQQEEVMNFIEFIEFKKIQNNSFLKDQIKPDETKPLDNLGERLKAIREEVVASGINLLNAEEIEQERKERQGGYQGD